MILYEGNLSMSQRKQSQPRYTYTSEFKQQLVDLYCSGKRQCNIVTAFVRADISGFFKEKDNRFMSI